MNNVASCSASDTVDLQLSGKSFSDQTRPRGLFSLVRRDVLGKIREVRISKNGVPNVGFAAIASRINGSGAEAAATYLAVGTGTNAFNASDTTLQTELASSGLSRVNATASRTTTTQTNDSATLVTTFTVTGTQNVTEAGVLNAASGGSLFARSVFSAVNVNNGDTLQLTYKIKVA